jgi:hypothetical protein
MYTASQITTAFAVITAIRTALQYGGFAAATFVDLRTALEDLIHARKVAVTTVDICAAGAAEVDEDLDTLRAELARRFPRDWAIYTALRTTGVEVTPLAGGRYRISDSRFI